jgi:SAM-dependent methyltransferase
MVRLDDEGFVQGQYGSTSRLETRISVWRAGPDGRTAQDVALELLAATAPARLLEVGCGTGSLAERCAAELRCDVTALDSSAAMVRATAAHGLHAMIGDVQELPFADGAFDCAVAAWMLYHVPDLGRAIAELARVLRPGGRLVAITNGEDSLRELWEAVGSEKLPSTFSRENGAESLGRHFAHVERHDVEATAVFADRAAAGAYMETLERGELADRLPDGPWPLIARGAPTVFAADRGA